MKKILFTCLSLIGFVASFSQIDQRFKANIFTTIDSVLNINYGSAINIKNGEASLLADIFSPKEDTSAARPLVIFVHGGGFQNGDKTGGFINLSRNYFVKKGFAFVSINYRVGIEDPKTNDQYFEALYRASSDVLTAIIYFKKHAATYNIDTSNIFLMGSSAGSKAIMGAMYMPADFITANMKKQPWGNVDFSIYQSSVFKNVKGVIDCWGAMPSYQWLNANSTPLFLVHGMADKTVPYDSSYSYHGFNYGALILYHQALSVGIPTGLRLFAGTGHTLDNNTIKQDSALQEIGAWVYAQLASPNNTYKNVKLGVRRWEKDIDSFAHDPLKTTYTNDAILVTGSSFIRYWSTIKKDLHPYEIIHRGYGVCNLSDMSYYINRILDNYTLKGVMIYVGNDIVVSKKDKTPLQVLEMYKYIVAQIRVKHPNIPIVWAAICPSVKRWAVWHQIKEANQMIKDYSAANKNLYVIDSPEVFFKKNTEVPDPSLYREDTLHFNAAGYKKWTSVIQPALVSIFQ
jgi:acetyl esterase/lipase